MIKHDQDLKDGTFLPWYAPRLDPGYIKNLMIKLAVLFMVKGISIRTFKVGLANLGYSRTDPKQMKVFSGAFPSFGHNFKNYVFAYIRVSAVFSFF
jgi:hypothetical protein